jgi:signal recognition particle subunit SEC65
MGMSSMTDPHKPKPNPGIGGPKGPLGPPSIGDILGRVIRKDGLGKREVKGRRLAQKAIADALGEELSEHVTAVGVKTGVATVEVDTPALFQEIEGFRREELLEVLRKAGLNVRELRVRLKQD